MFYFCPAISKYFYCVPTNPTGYLYNAAVLKIPPKNKEQARLAIDALRVYRVVDKAFYDNYIQSHKARGSRELC